MRSPSAALALVLALTLICATVLGETRRAPAFLVVVHPSNEASSIDRKFLEDAFLKKVTRWPSDQVIRPVDLAPGSPVRRAFSAEVLNRSVEAIKVYWQQRIFSGRDVPPPELDSDDEVIAYVLKHEGAVGYVSAAASLDGARVLGVVQ
jgi:ABC-type phosphate transport system substrate-binding protein